MTWAFFVHGWQRVIGWEVWSTYLVFSVNSEWQFNCSFFPGPGRSSMLSSPCIDRVSSAQIDFCVGRWKDNPGAATCLSTQTPKEAVKIIQITYLEKAWLLLWAPHLWTPNIAPGWGLGTHMPGSCFIFSLADPVLLQCDIEALSCLVRAVLKGRRSCPSEQSVLSDLEAESCRIYQQGGCSLVITQVWWAHASHLRCRSLWAGRQGEEDVCRGGGKSLSAGIWSWPMQTLSVLLPVAVLKRHDCYQLAGAGAHG